MTITAFHRSFMLLAAILAITAAPTIADEPVEKTAAAAEEEEIQIEATEVESGEEAWSDGRCPRCGRQRGWRGWRGGAESTDPGEATDQLGCRCGHGCRRGTGALGGGDRGGGPQDGRGPEGQLGRQGGVYGRHNKREEMSVYRMLLDNHEAIERTFEEIPGGIRSITTSTDPDLVPVIQRHVSQMTDLLENGGWIRRWDPLFAEIFKHADKIEMSYEEIENGVIVTETSEDEQIASLIRAHARKVMEFVGLGQEAYDEATPLPEGYESPASE